MQGTQLKKSWQRWLQSLCTWYRARRNHESAQNDSVLFALVNVPHRAMKTRPICAQWIQSDSTIS